MLDSRSVARFCVLLLALLGAGCMNDTPEALMYTLNSLDEMERNTGPIHPPEHNKAMSVGIGPVKFPDHLDRASIVTRTNKNQLNVNEFHRWGGSLEKNFVQVMVENMRLLLGTELIMARPWERYFKPDRRISLDVYRLDGRLGEYGIISATWRIFEKTKDEPIAVRRSTVKQPVVDGSYDALVEAQSRAIGELCLEIAEFINDYENNM